ncbi:MAG: cysteine desulfurase [Deltaproteobacteria bacterium]|nr:cysteine desulfurase [Deltaproteobacteria bacterium]
MKKEIYLDYQASTPVDPRVLKAMLPYFVDFFGNAASVHQQGLQAKAAVEHARSQVAKLLGVEASEIIFTSGATESNNLALLGLFKAFPQKKHFITAVTEHSSVLETAAYLESQGAEFSYLAVNKMGQVNLEELKKSIRPDTLVISLMAANNEIGTLHPLKEIGQIAKEAGVFFHSDAAQAVGKIPLDLKRLGVDLLSLSSHKFYGPKGIGALYLNQDQPLLKLKPILYGGGHEKGLRSGTLNVPAIMGLGEAARLSEELIPEESKRLQNDRDQLWQDLQKEISGLKLHGSLEDRLPHNLNFSVKGLSAERMLMELKGKLALSTASACTSAQTKPSHVLKALGLSSEEMKGSLRLSLGRMTSSQELSMIVRILSETIDKHRQSV